MNRRHFLMSSAAVGAVSARRAASANDKIRLGFAGIRGMGRGHVREFVTMPDVDIAALCDVDDSILSQRVKDVQDAGRKKPDTYTDFRKMLENKSVDAVVIATPNHWHTLQTIWACQAGKDVYVEKPLSHNIFESNQIVAAARKYNRIVQHGTQNRSSDVLKEGFQMLRDGFLGEVYMARGLCYKWRDTIGRTPPESVPSGVDYDLWTGPAPKRPFTRNRFHYNWHWFWDYGNGDIGNQGIHQFDVAMWGLGAEYPIRVSSMGGHFMFDDDQETPNTQVATFEFDGIGRRRILVFEVRHWITHDEAGIGGQPGNVIGNIFYGSKGYMVVSGSSYRTFLGKEQEPGPSKRGRGEDHRRNFLNAVRSRNSAELNGQVLAGAISCTAMHLGNISYRLGRTLNFDAKTMTCPGDAEATRMFTRQYRAPFVVPEKV